LQRGHDAVLDAFAQVYPRAISSNARSEPPTSRTAGAPTPAGAQALRKEVMEMDVCLTVLLLLIILRENR